MKLARCVIAGGSPAPFLAACRDEQWYDLSPALARRLGARGPFRFEDVLGTVVRNPADWQNLLTHAQPVVEEVRFLAPMTRPPRIFCLGRNFAAHAAEMGHKVAAEPMVFLKNPLSIIGPDESVEIPVGLGRVEHEVEVALVIGREGRAIAPEDAYLLVAGYTLFNDVTARELQHALQNKKWPWTLAKGPDTFGPMGPWLVTPDEFAWPPRIDLTLSVNGEPRQSGNTDQFVFSIPDVLAFISRTMRLVPGDVVSMGTPEGVASVAAGDVMECWAEGLGTLRSPVIWQPTEKGLEVADAIG